MSSSTIVARPRPGAATTAPEAFCRATKKSRFGSRTVLPFTATRTAWLAVPRGKDRRPEAAWKSVGEAVPAWVAQSTPTVPVAAPATRTVNTASRVEASPS